MQDVGRMGETSPIMILVVSEGIVPTLLPSAYSQGVAL